MAQDLYFEIWRDNIHLFVDLKDSQPISDLKRFIEGAIKIPVADQNLMRTTDEFMKSWQSIDERKSFQDNGLTPSLCKAQAPAVIAVCLHGESEPLITELSSPPPIPESMRQDGGNEQ